MTDEEVMQYVDLYEKYGSNDDLEDMQRDANRYRYIRGHMAILDELPLCEDSGELDQVIDAARGHG